MSALINKKMLSEIPDLYTQESSTDPLCHIKLFTPDSNWTWYIIECSHNDHSTCFGYVMSLEDELGYFSLQEIESIRGKLGLAVEIDTSFTPTQLSVVRKEVS